MKYLRIMMLSLFVGCMALTASDHLHSYFDTKFLSQPLLVRQQLIEKEGFTEGFLTSSDGIALHYLWLVRPNARCSIICSSGFWPGLKEGIATLYALFPDDCNILFFDARGHGASEGVFWRSLLNYGVCEYKDIEGAIEWVHGQSQQPIVLFGLCAGAFHAAHALISMERKQLIETYAIRGLIFDSGWGSVNSVVPTAFSGEWKKRMRKMTRSWPKALQSSIISPVSMGIKITTPLLMRVCLSKKTRHTNLLPKIQTITTPVLYIHAEDDSFAVIKPVKQLARKTQQAQVWWITESSTHACHHIKHAHRYKQTIKKFIDAVVPA